MATAKAKVNSVGLPVNVPGLAIPDKGDKGTQYAVWQAVHTLPDGSEYRWYVSRKDVRSGGFARGSYGRGGSGSHGTVPMVHADAAYVRSDAFKAAYAVWRQAMADMVAAYPSGKGPAWDGPATADAAAAATDTAYDL